jgi:septum formation protein
MPEPSLILASASRRRADLLQQSGLSFQSIPSEATEASSEHLTGTELCQLNAYRKARAVAKKHPDAVVLGADTLVFLENHRFGKPANLREARQMLSQLQGQTHQVVTGVCLLWLRQHRQKLFFESSEVTFHPLSPEQIERYLKAVNPLDKAGAYAIQERGELIVERVTGSFSNVVGLPLERVNAELKPWYSLPS